MGSGFRLPRALIVWRCTVKANLDVCFGDEVSKMNRTAYEHAGGSTIDVRWRVDGVLSAVGKFSIFLYFP